MITASEARKKAEAFVEARLQEEKNKIEASINRAVNEGKTSCRLGFEISLAAKEWLESLGYKVVRMGGKDPREEIGTEVIW